MYWFTADEHYKHSRIIDYCNRPFDSIDENDLMLMANHNSVVSKDDTTVHVGDFGFFRTKKEAGEYIRCLNGNHIFVRGSHDRWAPKSMREIWKNKIDGQTVVACHYAMRTWPASHHNSWLLYGHSHGRLPPQGKSWDVGVDCNGYFPVSWDTVKKIMEGRPDNFNYVHKTKA